MSPSPKVMIVMPAYNAEHTLEATRKHLPEIYSQMILCDDGSRDGTANLSRKLGLLTLSHESNRGYGANQKTLYKAALEQGADIIAMVHPDDQYDTSVLPAMIEQITSGKADLVLGVRMQSARENGMPLWKYIANLFLTFVQNRIYGTNASEFHSGLRAYGAEIFRNMPFQDFSDDFVFDSQLIAWSIANGFRLGEVPTRCFYRPGVSSVGFWPGLRYGLGSLRVLREFKKWKRDSGHAPARAEISKLK